MKSWVFKILRTSEWRTSQNSRAFAGAPIDVTDGYIHFSAIDQLQETANKYFSGEDVVHIIAFSATSWANGLKWEPSRGGMLFPHLYQPLDMTLAAKNWVLEKQTDSEFNIADIEQWAQSHD